MLFLILAVLSPVSSVRALTLESAFADAASVHPSAGCAVAVDAAGNSDLAALARLTKRARRVPDGLTHPCLGRTGLAFKGVISRWGHLGPEAHDGPSPEWRTHVMFLQLSDRDGAPVVLDGTFRMFATRFTFGVRARGHELRPLEDLLARKALDREPVELTADMTTIREVHDEGLAEYSLELTVTAIGGTPISAYDTPRK